MSAKDEQRETAHGQDLAALTADDAVLGDEGVPPAVDSRRHASQPPRAATPHVLAEEQVAVRAPQESVHLPKHNAMKHLPGIVAALALILLGAGIMIGVVIGKRSVNVATPERVTVTVTVPANANSREAIAKRNVVWRVLNNEADALPETPEKRLGQALGMIIGKKATLESRDVGFTAFIRKGAAYFDERQSDAIEQTLGTGSPAAVAEVMRKIVVADGEASDLLRGVLSDQKRIKNIVAGKKVPLETLPDGSTP